MGKLFVSYSSMSSFRKCPRFYYWKHIRRLEKQKLNIAFMVGRIMHHGIQTLFSNPSQAVDETKKKFKEEAKETRKKFIEIGADDEQEIAQQEFVTVGMIRAYITHYSQFLKGAKHIATEKSLQYDLNKKVVVVGKIDNIIHSQGRNCIYELKNLRSLDYERIESIKTDPQSSLYYEINNRIETKKENKVEGILYNIIRKPQIRQKKSESKGEFLRRLEDWYSSGDGGLKFHMERLKKPFIPGENVINTVKAVTDLMLRYKSKEDYYQDFGYCVHEWSRCQFYELCHGGGETKENLKLYQIRPKFKVQTDGGSED